MLDDIFSENAACLLALERDMRMIAFLDSEGSLFPIEHMVRYS